jgi:flagellar hook-basal body complex protein FliE
MSPLSAIQAAMPAYGLNPSTAITEPAMPLTGIQAPLPLDGAKGVTETQAGGSFSNILGRFIQDVNSKQLAASDAVASVQSGGNVPLHQAVIAMEEAGVSFQLMVEVRNKLLESYQELMRMQV